jgi:hypothetical protein
MKKTLPVGELDSVTERDIRHDLSRAQRDMRDRVTRPCHVTSRLPPAEKERLAPIRVGANWRAQ